jgi:DNA-binding LacI/PurR family transcriptional regulator
MATIYDVAKAAGVSPTTVSFVLNNSARSISPATRQRVLATMEALNFRPNAAARGLVRRRHDSIGVYLPTIGKGVLSNPYSAGLLDGIVEAATERGVDVTLVTRPVARAAETLHAGRMDGVLALSPQPDLDLESLARDLPVVTIAGPAPGLAWDNVDIDNAQAVRLVVEHLLQLGHTKLAHLTGSLDQLSARIRRDTFVAVLQEHGLLPYALIEGTYFRREVAAAGERLVEALRGPDRPTAVVCASDNLARAALNALRTTSLRVPEDVSLTGFDDADVSTLTTPRLTTLHQPLHELGRIAASLLLERIGGAPASGKSHLLPATLVVRDSTQPPS